MAINFLSHLEIVFTIISLIKLCLKDMNSYSISLIYSIRFSVLSINANIALTDQGSIPLSIP